MNATMVELQQPRTLIARVHGENLRILVDHPFVYLRRDDVEQLAAVPPWATGEQLLLGDDQVIEISGVEYYPLEWAMSRALEDSTDPTRGARFLSWIRDELPAYTSDQVLEQAHRIPHFATAHTVAAAARTLSADPTISIGRDGLFEYMATLAWIHRATPTRTGNPAGDWTISRTAHDRDWLTLRPITIGPATRHGQRRYLQIHITDAGLTELHRLLAGISAPAPPPPAHPTLFD